MKKTLAVLAAVSLLAAFGDAQARDYRLTCEMTRYDGAGTKRHIKKVVPQRAVHVISVPDARIEGTSMRGSAEDAGSRLTITYYAKLEKVGDAEIKYEFSKNSGRIVARTRGLRVIPWEDYFPERSGKFVIVGVCALE
jgi:hypothetical protein